jgi:hypothetical protein
MKLVVPSELLPVDAAPPLGGLQRLQELHAHSRCGNADRGVAAAALASLPHTLTRLRILHWSDPAPFGSSSVPGLASLVSLQQLFVSSASA